MLTKRLLLFGFSTVFFLISFFCLYTSGIYEISVRKILLDYIFGIPEWSPDSRRIIFVRGSDRDRFWTGVWTMDLDDYSSEEVIEPDVGHAEWSLDGKEIYFSTKDRANNTISIWAADSRGKVRRRIISNKRIIAYELVEGNRVVYALEGDEKELWSHIELWVVNSDGTGNRRLTDKVWYGKLEITPSPDGKFLALRGAFSESHGQSGTYNVWIMRLEDGKMNHVFHLDSILFNLNTHVEFLSWSPDGKKLIYQVKKNRFYVTEIDLETLEIVEERQVLGKEEAIRYLGGDAVTDKNFKGYFTYPEWSPVDNRVLVTRLGKGRGNEEIWMLDPDSGRMERLVDGFSPRWSPDGKKFSFLRYDKEKKESTVWIAKFED
ncbi:MAG: hypothetical protein ACUVXI_05330 [bacterium]